MYIVVNIDRDIDMNICTSYVPESVLHSKNRNKQTSF